MTFRVVAFETSGQTQSFEEVLPQQLTVKSDTKRIGLDRHWEDKEQARNDSALFYK
jgi:hypothetical protein